MWNRFLALWLVSQPVMAQAIKRSKTTAGQVNLTLEVCRDLYIPLPPLPEQEAIAEAAENQLSVIDHLEAGLDLRLESARALRPSILRHAFTGRLVPQDPDDEPASNSSNASPWNARPAPAKPPQPNTVERASWPAFRRIAGEPTDRTKPGLSQEVRAELRRRSPQGTLMDASQIGKRAWSYAGVLQDAGLSCFEYVEQLTLLLFLKMADRLTAPVQPAGDHPPQLGWQALLPLDGAALEDKYREILEKLAVKPGMLGVKFKSARCEIHNPALLKQLIVNLIEGVDWLELPVDVKGTIYEELLQRSAQESSRGAGQYFTPRPVIQAMCEVMQPTPADRICDPAAEPAGSFATPTTMCSNTSGRT